MQWPLQLPSLYYCIHDHPVPHTHDPVLDSKIWGSLRKFSLLELFKHSVHLLIALPVHSLIASCA